MAESAASILKRLTALRTVYGEDAAARKRDLLRRLSRRNLARPDDLLSLHECLCFWRAYPDDPALLADVETALGRFAARADLRRHAEALAGSGVAGTPVDYSFFWPTARWLAARWPERLTIDWDSFEQADQDRLAGMLHLLVSYSETPALDMLDRSLREWIELLKGPRETDAAFLIGRFAALRGSTFDRETLFESFNVPFRLSPGRGTPSRTHARFGKDPVAWQDRSLDRSRPKLRAELERPPRRVRVVPVRDARELIDLARGAMVTRERDLEVFAQASPHDVRLVDCGGGLQLACIGAVPERRLMLEAVYGFLTLKNGIPIGYVLASSLFESTEVAYNIFETYRGAEAAPVFGRVLAMIRHLFGARVFSIDPYQLGYGNAEGLQSGAWWFYYKLGFRPRDPEVLRVLRGELAKMKRNPSHRSDAATLERLASEYVFFDLDRSRRDVLGGLPLGNIGLRIADYLAGRFGAEREKALRICSREAADLLGVRLPGRFSRAERQAWKRWGPLVLILPGVKRWSPRTRRALAQVVKSKGGRREIGFIKRFDAHAPLRRAVLKLTEETG